MNVTRNYKKSIIVFDYAANHDKLFDNCFESAGDLYNSVCMFN